MKKNPGRSDRLRAHRRAERRNRDRRLHGSQAGIVGRATTRRDLELDTLPRRGNVLDLPQRRSWWRRVFRRAA